ncbi:unnamed protein product [Clonostachys byssicola]|uniref:Uncharacterized protein n=1 Tax=Clonostachys byssicola TaxID=160290 RepID=A0A9N9YA88_9HYPO|nr:unnamed protein product [Clonostachys byssicola]
MAGGWTLGEANRAQTCKHQRAQQAKDTGRSQPLFPEYDTVRKPQIAADDYQEGVEGIISPLGVEDEHKNAQTGGASSTGLPDGPRLGHVGDAFWQTVLQHNTGRVAADDGPDGAPTLGGCGEERGKMAVLEIAQHDECL